MDFHCLTRKELQTLCKKNKIPANITNVAMADALKALEIVEGLDELMNQSQSPEKTMNKSSQEIPSTVTRTSTRRKPTKEEPPSSQTTTRTRRMTRRTMELDEENKNVNVSETPVVATTTRRRAQRTEPEVGEQKKSDLLETPASQSNRRRAGVGSTRRKVEAQKGEGSVQQGYGTRRSVRLLEKSMEGLSLKESGRMEPVKIDEMVEDEIEENKNRQSGPTSEETLARNLSVSLEGERDLKDDVHNAEYDCTVISEAGSQKPDNLYCLLALDTNDAYPDEKTNEPDAYLAESADKLADMSDGTMDPKGYDYAVPQGSYEIDNSSEELVAENNGGSHADENTEVLDHASSAEYMEPIEAVVGEECQKLVAKDCDINVVNDDLAKLPEAEEYDDGKASQNDSAMPEGLMDSLEMLGNEESEDDPDQIVTGSNIVVSDVDDNSGSDNNTLVDELQEEVPCETAAYCSDDPMSSMVNEEALMDVNVVEAEIIYVGETSFYNAPQSVAVDISVDKILDSGDAEALVDVCVKAAEEYAETTQEVPSQKKSPTAAKLTSPCASLVSNSARTSSIPLSPLTAQFSQPTRSTPRKSSSKKQPTIPKMTQVSDKNKENIDNNSEKEVEPSLAKVKKNKNIIDEETMQKLEDMSLRNLKKLTKKFDKLKIADLKKNKEDKNDSMLFGKTRPALQILSQNCIPAGEAEEEN
ncbi:uncharacterized protein LOC110415186 [Herrania umbratica]|uniref:Uncharacterized protein LOC110415186 n=1 Tax=Herrania umbratica TaxID=108875 RepID=A0A6J1A6T4_9ROSI|nr:uncharacterized protein LOC110415186 [Herrania umbratica]